MRRMPRTTGGAAARRGGSTSPRRARGRPADRKRSGRGPGSCTRPPVRRWMERRRRAVAAGAFARRATACRPAQEEGARAVPPEGRARARAGARIAASRTRGGLRLTGALGPAILARFQSITWFPGSSGPANPRAAGIRAAPAAAGTGEPAEREGAPGGDGHGGHERAAPRRAPGHEPTTTDRPPQARREA